MDLIGSDMPSLVLALQSSDWELLGTFLFMAINSNKARTYLSATPSRQSPTQHNRREWEETLKTSRRYHSEGEATSCLA